MVERKLESLIKRFGLTEESFFKALSNSYSQKRYKKFISRILNIDDYLLFKKMMIKKNKELEYQAMKMVNKDEKEPIDKYEADLHYAIALS